MVEGLILCCIWFAEVELDEDDEVGDNGGPCAGQSWSRKWFINNISLSQIFSFSSISIFIGEICAVCLHNKKANLLMVNNPNPVKGPSSDILRIRLCVPKI